MSPALWTMTGDYEPCQCGHHRSRHRVTGGQFECSLLRDDASVCPCPQFRPVPLADFYVHWNGGAWFVKEAHYFKFQGGMTAEWGKAWQPIQAMSIEHARALAAATLPKKVHR